MPAPHSFYVHHKHDPSVSAHDHMYEVVGIARHTEEKTFLVLYRPLYANDWLPPADVQARPLEMFTDMVEKHGLRIPRFKLIEDPALIAELSTARAQMYPDAH